MKRNPKQLRTLPLNARREMKPSQNPETMRRLNEFWEAEGHLSHSCAEIARAVGVTREAVRLWEAEGLRQLERGLTQAFGGQDALREELLAIVSRRQGRGNGLDGSMGLLEIPLSPDAERKRKRKHERAKH